jgi:hypothetical protein
MESSTPCPRRSLPPLRVLTRRSAPTNTPDAPPEDSARATRQPGARGGQRPTTARDPDGDRLGRREGERRDGATAGTGSLAPSTDDRQMLVVGAGLAGLAMAATLRHAGYDPVVLSGGERVLPSRLAVLHPVGQALFDQLATDDPTSGHGVVRLDDAAEPGDGRLDGGPPVAVEAATFGTRLQRLVPDSAVREDGVRRLERERDVLRVWFESGVREWFDLVVVAGGPDSTVHGLGESSPETDPALQVETRVDGGHASLAPSRGVWTDEGLVQTFPHPDGGWTDATGPADSDDSPLAWVGRYLSASRRASDALATTARI